MCSYRFIVQLDDDAPMAAYELNRQKIREKRATMKSNHHTFSNSSQTQINQCDIQSVSSVTIGIGVYLLDSDESKCTHLFKYIDSHFLFLSV